MNTQIDPLVASAQGIAIRSPSDISDALGACLWSSGLILAESDLSDTFFDLRSGLAGELFQKFTNYRVPVAIVLADFHTHGERFSELATEHATHDQIRFVHSLDEACLWLSSFALAKHHPDKMKVR